MSIDMQNDHGPDQRSPPSLRTWVFVGFLFVAGFFLLTEHRAHVFGVLPYLLLLACPLMHFFGHGHGGHGEKGTKPNPRDGYKNADPPEHRQH